MKTTLVIRVLDRMLITLIPDEQPAPNEAVLWYTINILKGNDGGDHATYRQIRMTGDEILAMGEAVKRHEGRKK